MYDVQKGALLYSLEGHTSWVLNVAFSIDGSQLYSSSSDRSVKVWDVTARKCLQTFHDAHSDQVWGVARDPQGGRFCSAGDDKVVCLYEQEAPPGTP